MGQLFGIGEQEKKCQRMDSLDINRLQNDSNIPNRF
jgi:hypothetical protein